MAGVEEMTDHTPEPWRGAPHYLSILGDPERDGYDDCVIIADCEVRDAAAPPPDQQEANLARIVACVNACAGIPTERLEDYWTKVVATLTEQNWDRLAACANACAGIPTERLNGNLLKRLVLRLGQAEDFMRGVLEGEEADEQPWVEIWHAIRNDLAPFRDKSDG